MTIPITQEKLDVMLTSLGLTTSELTKEELESLTWLAETVDWRGFYQLNSVFEKAKKNRGV